MAMLITSAAMMPPIIAIVKSEAETETVFAIIFTDTLLYLSDTKTRNFLTYLSLHVRSKVNTS